MIKATMITANGNKEVQVLDAKTEGKRKLAEIRRMDGTKFPQYTHGGWAEITTKWVSADRIFNVRREA